MLDFDHKMDAVHHKFVPSRSDSSLCATCGDDDKLHLTPILCFGNKTTYELHEDGTVVRIA